MGGVKRSKESFHNIVRLQSVLKTSFGKIVGIKETQIDSDVTTHSTINIELISHEAPTKTKNQIDIKPLTKIKCKNNLNHHTDEIRTKSKMNLTS